MGAELLSVVNHPSHAGCCWRQPSYGPAGMSLKILHLIMLTRIHHFISISGSRFTRFQASLSVFEVVWLRAISLFLPHPPSPIISPQASLTPTTEWWSLWHPTSPSWEFSMSRSMVQRRGTRVPELQSLSWLPHAHLRPSTSLPFLHFLRRAFPISSSSVFMIGGDPRRSCSCFCCRVCRVVVVILRV